MANKIWVVDDDSSMVWVMEKALSKQGYAVTTFGDGNYLLEALKDDRPDLVISDIRMPSLGGFELLQQINKISQNLPVIVITAFGDLDSAVDSYKFGAYEYLTKPFDIDELLSVVARGLESSCQTGNGHPSPGENSKQMLGDSAAMQEVFRVIGRIAPSDMGVLIRGESGTGKELVADAIHRNSNRSDRPLVAINTAAIPAELLESELFGHEKGAFTGAHSRHIGRFEQAHESTLFLDEIGDMPLALQTRLLRVLSEGRFYRVGGRVEVFVDVRIIAATNQNLESLVSQGKFRNDLFHRLNVLSVHIPKLCERPQDIPILVEHFLQQAARSHNTKPKQLAHGVVDLLQNYDWPGNVRELQNSIQQVSILTAGSKIELSDLDDKFRGPQSGSKAISWQKSLEYEVARRLRLGEKGLAKSMGQEFEEILIHAALAHTSGFKQKAAQLLGWGRNTLSRKMM